MGNANNGYQCWRISGTLSNSINSCPDGNLESCMNLLNGDTCTKGMKVYL